MRIVNATCGHLNIVALENMGGGREGVFTAPDRATTFAVIEYGPFVVMLCLHMRVGYFPLIRLIS